MRQTFHIGFIKKSKIFFGISLGIMLVCLILNIFAFPTKVDIKFTGGTLIKFSYDGEINEDDLKAFVEETLDKTEEFKGDRPTYTFSNNLMVTGSSSNHKTVTLLFPGRENKTTTAPSAEQTSKVEESSMNVEDSKVEETSETAEASKTEEVSASGEASKAAEVSQTSEASQTAEASAETEASKSTGTNEPTETSMIADSSAAAVTAKAEEASSAAEISTPIETIGAVESSESEIIFDVDSQQESIAEENSAEEASDTSDTVTNASSVNPFLRDVNILTDALKEKYPQANFEMLNANDVSPSMGGNFFLKCLAAVILAAVIMIFYVALRFRKIGGLSAGIMAVIALIHDLIIVYFVFALFRMPLDDNFIAVVLMILGYSLNDTIVIYDRVRENRKKSGPRVPIGTVVNNSLNQCFVRTICTSVTTIIAIGSVLVVSLMFNITSIVSFALPMMIGLISGSYSSLCIAAPLWVMWKNHKNKKLGIQTASEAPEAVKSAPAETAKEAVKETVSNSTPPSAPVKKAAPAANKGKSKKKKRKK